ncbi:DNA mismatch repair protein MutS [Youxingia wuxianensis]|uniref:DNA mismatch repair protein MutS n=1 Tax=Youxingia wuxianensis TaxID=2763678 RepID=A0A926EPT6_9FIRM|nr:DNA mismatch repair protein MutS [Youxingia wuxianensis]MBC8584329.1 DNA mismatch repair protein MutS [Youxingia wuxianensis]
MQNLSPMMQQYFAVKEKHPGHIVFFRLGDFYEMFFDDAIVASKELELTLTGRDCGQQERAPMCGVPYHSCDAYIARLIKKGFKVAICEQVENPKEAKGMVKREVIRVITPGTLIESNMLSDDTNNYIACVFSGEEGYALACADISTGQLFVSQFEKDGENELVNELGRYSPSEIIFNGGLLEKKTVTGFIKDKLGCIADLLDDDKFQAAASRELITRHFSKAPEELGLEGRELSVQVLGALLAYLYETQQKGLERITAIGYVNPEQYMTLDITARRNLEIVQTMRTGEKKGTLLWVLDKTKTAMGKRLLRSFLDKPLLNPAMINKRLNAVEELYSDTLLRCDVTEQLSGVFDLERLMTRIIYGNASPREFRSLQYTATALPGLKSRLSGCQSAYLCEVCQGIDPLEDISRLIDSAIVEEPPALLKDGSVIKDGYDAQLDELRGLVHNTKQILVDIETLEKEKTGIKNLKIGYNRVFGYYIEVTKSYLDLVPQTYIRKQTLANCERYITQELKELEEKILTAGEKILILENSLFEQVRAQIAANLNRIQTTAAAIARLDVYASFAAVAANNNYCRPQVDFSSDIIIKEGRHPVVELLMNGAPFVANDTVLNNSDKQIAIITGPNMAGKSTYMRQTALIVLMAQIGSFVPAVSADIGVVDGIYTRVGASDDLASGQSTFMVEMTEVAHLLREATSRSLLILDEIGRGTSTFDGMSIARAVIEYIADKHKVGAKTLFATHYHELTELEQQLSSVKNYNIACKKRGDDIIFLRRIIPGGADDSYGIEVSKLAGVPDWIIKRAHQVLEQLEDGKTVDPVKKKGKPQEVSSQISFETVLPSEVEEALRQIDVNTLTPIEALNRLYELKKLLKE